MKPDKIIPGLLKKHPLVKSVCLTGSRSRHEATEWSDWDFLVEVSDFNSFVPSLPELFRELKPLSWLWDPLSRHRIFMLILKGPVKIDIIFDLPHELESPWKVNKDSLVDIDRHFWDWIYWIASKKIRGKEDLVKNQLEKMHDFLLVPLGCLKCPDAVEDAEKKYTMLMQRQLDTFSMDLDYSLKNEVINGLKRMGFRL